MRVYVYDKYSSKYEIKQIEYTQFNGRDTYIEYDYKGETRYISYDGWLSLEEIVKELQKYIDDDYEENGEE